MISVIILNYFTSQEVENCLRSIFSFEFSKQCKFKIIDNFSDIDLLKTRTNAFENVELIALAKNSGYAVANNIAAQADGSEYLLFLNPDTLFKEDCISPIIEFMQNNINAGACAPMLLNNDSSYQTSSGSRFGFIYEFLEAFMLIDIYRRLYFKINVKRFSGLKPIKVGWVSGACLLVRSNLYKKIGGFNEKFFLNYEDIDFCLRLEKAGHKNYYFPYLNCIHYGLVSQRKDFQNYVYDRYKSKLIFAKENYGFVMASFTRVVHIIGLLLRLLIFSFMQQNRENHGRLAGYKNSLKLYLKPSDN